jgi:hypothetical protein
MDLQIAAKKTSSVHWGVNSVLWEKTLRENICEKRTFHFQTADKRSTGKELNLQMNNSSKNLHAMCEKSQPHSSDLS